MAKKCTICNREDRADIENAILQMTSAATPEERTSLDEIAKQFDITGADAYNELKMHALFHMPLVTKYDLEAADDAAQATLEKIGPEFEPGAVICNAAVTSDGTGPNFLAPATPVIPATSGAAEVSGASGAASSTLAEGRMSMSQKMKLLEADMLTAVNNEYLVTLKAMGRRINKLASRSSIDSEDEDKQLWCAKLMTKPMVDLYLGLGAEIRKNVATLTEVDRALNGPQDSAATGLAALANAIRSSGGSAVGGLNSEEE